MHAVFPVVLWPLMMFAIIMTGFLTVAIAWERYEAINYPYNYQCYQEYRAMKIVSSLIVAAFILNIGKFFEFQPSPCIKRSVLIGVLEVRDIFKNQIYALYNTVILRILVGGVIPVTLLTYFYTMIFIKIWEHNLNIASHNAIVKKKMMREQKMAIIFAGVVMSSIVCTIPGWLIVIKILRDGDEVKNMEYYETVTIG